MATQIETARNAPDLVETKRKYLWPCVYHFYQDPPVIVRGEGAYLFDASGNRYLDCYSGVGVMNAGHGNRQILAAASEQMARLQHTTTIYLTDPMLSLAKQLAQVTPGGLNLAFFCASGSEANEAALLLAALATGRNQFLAFDGGLHGRTKAAMSATALSMWRTDPAPLDCFDHAPSPTDPDCLAAVESVLSKEDVAAVIIEPIQGNGGIIIPPTGFLQTLRALCDRYGSLLIFDEVQTGFGRTGKWFAAESAGVVPDVLTVVKALGNGFPIAAALTTQPLAAHYTRPGASTFGGNPMSCAAALAVLDYHREHGLADRARAEGSWFGEALTNRLDENPWVHEIRGRGLMWGVELRRPDGRIPGDEFGGLLEALKDKGFLVGRTGTDRNVITLMPPLVVQREDLESLLDALCWELDRLEPIH